MDVSDVGQPATDAAVVLRLGTAGDAGAAAHLHAGSISEGFLARLGPRFLRHLYRRVVLSPESFLLIAEDGNVVAGFLAGSVDVRALYRRFVLRDGIRATATSLPRLLVAWPRAWETLRHGAEAGGSAAPNGSAGSAGSAGPGLPEAELLSMAVDPAWRGRHVGALLVDGFFGELERRSVTSARVVVGAHNAPAISLYEGAGFRPVERFELHRGTSSLLMRRPSTPPLPTPGDRAPDSP